jgi:hypothetical protein
MIELARRKGMDSYLELQRQLPGQLAFFVAGAVGYYHFQYLEKNGIELAALAAVVFTLQMWLPWMAILLWHRLEKPFLRKFSHYVEACQS